VRPRLDLHTHTNASDGELAPAQLVERALAAGVTVLGITDHDTTAGVEAAAALDRPPVPGASDLEIIPGVELGCEWPDDHVDVLGYLIDPAEPKLVALLDRIRDSRRGRMRTMVTRLQALGAPIEAADVEAMAGSGAVGRPHVARALVAAGFVPDVASAFHQYIGRNGPAFAERYRLTVAQACRVIRGAGGVPVLAHPVPPGRAMRDARRLRRLLDAFVPQGLGGLECYYPGYTAATTRWLEALAHHYALVPTGGTDFHGSWRSGLELGDVDVPPLTVERLRQAVRAGPAGGSA
jgi:predicted metal-dependent phosphoesterase TrpH